MEGGCQKQKRDACKAGGTSRTLQRKWTIGLVDGRKDPDPRRTENRKKPTRAVGRGQWG
jgi:hypothetical protein